MRLLLLLLLATALAASPAAQPIPFAFGSADDPDEPSAPPGFRPAARAALYAGPSYIGTRWRVGAGAEATGTLGPLSVALEGRLRASPAGLYEPDLNEPYDALRAVRYARLNPTARLPLYARLGPLTRTTLGTGLLVRDLHTTAAWDERTVGVEAALHLPLLDLEAFTADVRMDRLVGGRVALRPLAASRHPRRRSLTLGASAIRDPGALGAPPLTAVAAEAHLDVLYLGDFHLRPYAAAAQYLDLGRGGTIGVAFGSDDLAGFGRAHAAAGLTFSTARFIPGYFNAFYAVDNPAARIVNSDAYFRDRATAEAVGTPLEASTGGTALVLEARALVFHQVELAPYLRRDFGGSTGEFGLRLAATPGGGETLRLLFELHRQGLTGLRALFSDITDEAVLAFTLDYQVTGPVRLSLRSSYGYVRVSPPGQRPALYLVERRFEPMVGVTLRP